MVFICLSSSSPPSLLSCLSTSFLPVLPPPLPSFLPLSPSFHAIVGGRGLGYFPRDLHPIRRRKGGGARDLPANGFSPLGPRAEVAPLDGGKVGGVQSIFPSPSSNQAHHPSNGISFRCLHQSLFFALEKKCFKLVFICVQLDRVRRSTNEGFVWIYYYYLPFLLSQTVLQSIAMKESL